MSNRRLMYSIFAVIVVLSFTVGAAAALSNMWSGINNETDVYIGKLVNIEDQVLTEPSEIDTTIAVDTHYYLLEILPQNGSKIIVGRYMIADPPAYSFKAGDRFIMVVKRGSLKTPYGDKQYQDILSIKKVQ